MTFPKSRPISDAVFDRYTATIENVIRNINKKYPKVRDGYQLERGNMVEGLAVQLFESEGIKTERNIEYIPGKLLQQDQIDITVYGGTSGTPFLLEVKGRDVIGGKRLFSYPDILVGCCRNWDLKNAACFRDEARLAVSFIVCVDERNYEIWAAPTDLESQLKWTVKSYGDNEPSYCAPNSSFVHFSVFCRYLKTL